MPIPLVEPLGKVRTKIVATLGPASRDPGTLRRLIEAGVDVFRLNFSHGTHEEHSALLRDVRRVAEECDRQIGVLQDLGGPKIRLGPILGDSVACAPGAEFQLVFDRKSDDPHELTCSYRELVNDLKPGDQVLFADGAVAMEVADVGPGLARLVVTLPGLLRSNQGVNLPGADLKIKALTNKDLSDLDWTRDNPVEFVGLSFVRSADDVLWLRSELRARNIDSLIVSKIEKPQAVANFDAILAATDAVMVARGDLGVEMDVARVPAIQKRIISACHAARVPVITATQMLASMETSSRPTRAEAGDVFNAVLDGTDAVMLSGETAIGAYPVESVSMMSRIAAEAEALLTSPSFSSSHPDPGPAAALYKLGWITETTEVVVEAAAMCCRRLKANLVVVATHSGKTAIALSKQRYDAPTLALTDGAPLARKMSLLWGVTPILVPELTDGNQSLAFALDWARTRGLISRGDRAVLVRGTIPGNPVHNAVLVQEVE
ncbi:MAG: pyruvate kinase [Planctomycetota bacterium]|nr:pyruvate kinase [Planctomycetota bacterium]